MRMVLALIMISVFLTGCGLLTYGAVAAGGGTRTLIRDVSRFPLPPVDEDQSRVFFFGDNTRYISRSEAPWQPYLSINGSLFSMKYGTLIAFCVDLNPGILEIHSGNDGLLRNQEIKLKQEIKPGEIYYVHMRVSGKSAETYRLDFSPIEPPIARRMIRNHTFTGDTLVPGSDEPFRCLTRYDRNYI